MTGPRYAFNAVAVTRSYSPHFGAMSTEQVKWGEYERVTRSEEHTSELQSRVDLVCRLLLEKKKKEQRNVAQNVDSAVEDEQKTGLTTLGQVHQHQDRQSGSAGFPRPSSFALFGFALS